MLPSVPRTSSESSGRYYPSIDSHMIAWTILSNLNNPNLGTSRSINRVNHSPGTLAWHGLGQLASHLINRAKLLSNLRGVRGKSGHVTVILQLAW